MGNEQSTPQPGVYLRYSIEECKGNGLQQLVWLTDSKLVTRGFKNHIKRLGIFRPAYTDKHQARPVKVVERRYDPTMSNRRFKYLYVKRNKSPFGLKDIPKQDVERMEYRFPGAPLSNHKAAGILMREKLGLRPKARLPRTRPARAEHNFIEKYIVPQYRNRNSLSETRKPGKNLPKVGKVSFDQNGAYTTFLGGQILRFRPKPEHKKYWYFRRKAGYWHFSQHHPYGDEYESYSSILSKTN